MKKLRILVLCGLLAVVLASCGGRGGYVHYELNLDYAMNRAHERRLGIIKPDYNLLITMTEGRTPADLPDYDLPTRRESATVTLEEALHDVDIFFQALYNAYGGYVYFGGCEVFLPIRDRVIQSVTAYRNRITPSMLQRILYRHLSPVIIDVHFQIGDQRLGRGMFYLTTHADYERTTSGFFNADTGLRLMYVEGYDVGDIMRLHADETGRVFYRPIIKYHMQNLRQVAFTYEDDTVIYRDFRTIRHDRVDFGLPNLEFHEGIPVVSVRTMGFDGHPNASNYEHAVAFLSFVPYLIDEPIVIVDVRSNGGGNGLLGGHWLYALTGEIVPTNFVGLRTMGFDPEFHEFDPDDLWQSPPGMVLPFLGGAEFADGYSLIQSHPDRIVERDQKLIVLTDRGTGSAAESFTDRTMNMTNTLVVGAPTSGVLAFDRFYPSLWLPNTGLFFGFGRTMFLWPEGHFAENVGAQPDVWADGDSLAVALALLTAEHGE